MLALAKYTGYHTSLVHRTFNTCVNVYGDFITRCSYFSLSAFSVHLSIHLYEKMERKINKKNYSAIIMCWHFGRVYIDFFLPFPLTSLNQIGVFLDYLLYTHLSINASIYASRDCARCYCWPRYYLYRLWLSNTKKCRFARARTQSLHRNSMISILWKDGLTFSLS